MVEAQFQNQVLTPVKDPGVSMVDVGNNQYILLQQYELSATDFDLVLRRLDPKGHALPLAIRIGSSKKEFPMYLQKAKNREGKDDGFILVGSTEYGNENGNTDLFLIRTNNNGDIIWSRRYGDKVGKDYGVCVIQMPDFGFVAVGYSSVPGTNKTRAYALCTDPSGNPIWNRTYENPSHPYQTALHVDLAPKAKSDGLFLTGTIRNQQGVSGVLVMNLNPQTGDVVWANQYHFNKSSSDLGKGIRIVNYPQNEKGYAVAVTGSSSSDEFTFLLNPNGAAYWGFRYATKGITFRPAGLVRATPQSTHIVVGGSYVKENSRLVYLHKIQTSNGNHVLSSSYRWDGPGIQLADIRQTFGSRFSGIGVYQNKGNTYVLNASAGLTTPLLPTECKADTLQMSQTKGILSSQLKMSGPKLSAFDYKVLKTTMELKGENGCF